MTTNQAFKLLSKYLEMGFDIWVYDLPYEPYKSKVLGIEISDKVNIDTSRSRKWLGLENKVVVDFRGAIEKIKAIDYRGIPRSIFKILDNGEVDSLVNIADNFVLKVPTKEAIPGDLFSISGNLYPILDINYMVDNDGNIDREEYYQVLVVHSQFLVDGIKINSKDKSIYIYTFLNNLNHED